MEQQVYLLRNVAARMGVSPLKQVALQPGVKSVHRVTVHYDPYRAADAVITLRRFGMSEVICESVFLGRFSHKPLIHKLTMDRYEQFTHGLLKLQFDKLTDQQGVPYYGADLWLVERAAGSFVKGVVVCPQLATGEHLALITHLRHYLTEVNREIP
jgi:hypothetical protein